MTIKSRIAQFLNQRLWHVGVQLQRLDQSSILSSLLYKNLHPNFFFLQIGANDGLRADPIYKFVKMLNLRGLAVEPLPDMFQELQQTYRNLSKVRLANVAIHRVERNLTLYRVKADADVPDWAHGIASSNPIHYQLSGTNPDDIEPVTVPALPLDELLATYDVENLDLFVSDTEGYDHEIVGMLLDTHHRPSIISFEHGLLQGTMSQDAYLDLTKRLMTEGYLVLTEAFDAVAYKA